MSTLWHVLPQPRVHLLKGSEHTLNLLFVIKNAKAVPWEQALAWAQVGRKYRPLLVDVWLSVWNEWVVSVQFLEGRCLHLRTSWQLSLVDTLVGSLCGEVEESLREERKFDVPSLRSVQQQMMEHSAAWDREGFGGWKQKIIPTARKRTVSEDLDVSKTEMNLNYLSTISLVFPFPLICSLCFITKLLLLFSPSLSQGMSSEVKEHLRGCPPYCFISSASDFPVLLIFLPGFIVPLFSCT